MLFTSATSVSRWRTPPIAGRVAVDAGEQHHPVRRHQVGRRPGGDLGLDVDPAGSSGPSASRMKSA